jgi:hypothetical protein
MREDRNPAVICSASVCGLSRTPRKDFMHFAHRMFLRLTVLMLAVVLCPLAIHAQGALESCGNPAGPSGDLSVHLTLKDGQKVFREGEIITLTAEYRTCGTRKYSLNTKNYDRSGRLEGMEVFHIEPNRGVDPLADYFNSRTYFSTGGLYSDQDLNEKPFAIDLELNEWQSLPPGTYRLSITGHRVSAKNEKDPIALDGEPFPLHSNVVEFQVVEADAEWQAAELATATTAMDSPLSSKDEKQHAVRVLRFLGSKGSTQELARRYGSAETDINGERMFGLFGSPSEHWPLRRCKQKSRTRCIRSHGNSSTRSYPWRCNLIPNIVELPSTHSTIKPPTRWSSTVVPPLIWQKQMP